MMARSPKRRARRPTRSARATRSVPSKPSEAEQRLLALARELAALGVDPLPRAVDLLAVAYAPDAPLPRAMYRASLAGRGDKTAMLALAWAREQVRMALEEILIGSRTAVGLSPETHAWVLLAACEALAHEPPSAVADRRRALVELTRRAH
jgi:hypothetical protein